MKNAQRISALLVLLAALILGYSAFGDANRRRINGRPGLSTGSYTAAAPTGQTCFDITYAADDGANSGFWLASTCAAINPFLPGDALLTAFGGSPSETVTCSSCLDDIVTCTGTTEAISAYWTSTLCFGEASAYSTPPVLDPAQFPGVRYWFAPWYTAHSWQETGETTAELTHVTADGQSFGSWQDPVFGSQTWASSAARRGVSGTLDGRAYYECSATSSNDQLVIQASQDMFRSFHTDRTGTIALRIDPVTANGTAFIIFDSNNLTGAQRGVYIQRTTANRLSIVVTNGTTSACNHTSVATVTSGNASLVDVIVRYNAGAVEVNVGDATEETFTCANAGSAGSSGQEFTFCGQASGAGSTSMRIGELVISDTRWTDAQVTAWRALTTARTTDPIGCSASGVCPFLHTQYDFTLASTLWEDSGATDQVETVGDSVFVVRDPRDLSNYLRRQATSVGATHPTWQDTTGVDWADRITDDLIWQSTWGRAGARTVFSIVDCDDLVYGCRHQYASANSYAVVTAGAYSGNVTTAYAIVHAAAGTAGDGTSTIPTPDGRNCLVWQRDGSSWLVGAQGGGVAAATNAETFQPVSIGNSSVADWYMDGRIEQLRSYQTAIPQSEWAAICADMGL